MSTEYTISSKVIECGSNGRTIPFFFPWLDSVTESPLPELSERQLKKNVQLLNNMTNYYMFAFMSDMHIIKKAHLCVVIQLLVR
jgi:hypothetical protein